MNGGKYFVAFVLGAAAGSAAAWKYLKDKYAKIAQDEIDSVKEVYRKKAEERKERLEHLEKVSDDLQQAVHAAKPDIGELAEIARKSGYTKYNRLNGTEEASHSPDIPQVITPEEFGEDYAYERISLIHYADGVLADEDDDPVDGLDEAVGRDYANHFGEYEADTVYIRNDVRRCYYEIQRDEREYQEATGNTPPNWWEEQ